MISSVKPTIKRLQKTVKSIKLVIANIKLKIKKYKTIINYHYDNLMSITNFLTDRSEYFYSRIHKMKINTNNSIKKLKYLQNKLNLIYTKINALNCAYIDYIKYKIDDYLHLMTHDIIDAVNNMFKHIVNINNIKTCNYKDDEWFLFNETDCIGNPSLYVLNNIYDIKITLYNKSFKIITITLNELYETNPYINHVIKISDIIKE